MAGVKYKRKPVQKPVTFQVYRASRRGRPKVGAGSKRVVTGQLGRGVTVYRGTGGYGKHGEGSAELDILLTVVTRLGVP